MSRFLLVVILSLTMLLGTVAGAVGAQQDLTSGWVGLKNELTTAKDFKAAGSKESLSALSAARTMYKEIFEGTARSQSPAQARQITNSLYLLERAIVSGDKMEAMVQSQTVQKILLGVAYTNVKGNLGRGKAGVPEAAAWFSILRNQFKWNEDPSPTSKKMDQLLNDPGKVSSLGKPIIDGLTVKFQEKVAEEVDEAVVMADKSSKSYSPDEAVEKAVEGQLYFQVVRSDIAARISPAAAAAVAGHLGAIVDATVDGQLSVLKTEAEAVQETFQESQTGSTPSKATVVAKMNVMHEHLGKAITHVEAGNATEAKKSVGMAWKTFVAVESSVRQLDTAAYVEIEGLFSKQRVAPTAEGLKSLQGVVDGVAKVAAGSAQASKASVLHTALTTWERVQPMVFVLLALLGVYPLYLIYKAFGWRHKAWRNIGIFVFLLVIPTFMEAVGRVGVETETPFLQGFSFMVNEWAKAVWALLLFTAFLFAISGLRTFCHQFGIRAFGVKQDDGALTPSEQTA